MGLNDSQYIKGQQQNSYTCVSCSLNWLKSLVIMLSSFLFISLFLYLLNRAEQHAAFTAQLKPEQIVRFPLGV